MHPVRRCFGGHFRLLLQLTRGWQGGMTCGDLGNEYMNEVSSQPNTAASSTLSFSPVSAWVSSSVRGGARASALTAVFLLVCLVLYRRPTSLTWTPRAAPAWSWPCWTPEGGSGLWWPGAEPRWSTGRDRNANICLLTLKCHCKKCVCVTAIKRSLQKIETILVNVCLFHWLRWRHGTHPMQFTNGNIIQSYLWQWFPTCGPLRCCKWAVGGLSIKKK